VRLGALDFAERRRGQPAAARIQETVALAPHLESLGYSRYWLGEHHQTTMPCPELLLGAVATTTSRIRIGTGAILLTYHSPLGVAERAGMLGGLAPSRIDVGVGRGMAGPLHHDRLLDGRAAADVLAPAGYEARLRELARLLREWPEPGQGLGCPPELWVTASSATSGAIAARLDLRVSLALFFARAPGPGMPGSWRSVAVAGVCAETESAARARVAVDYLDVRPTVVDSPAGCAARLRETCSRHGVDEVLFLDVSSTFEAKRRSYELLAEACDAGA
jgi:luciferase family oxidoreductase group 1